MSVFTFAGDLKKRIGDEVCICMQFYDKLFLERAVSSG